VWLTDRIVRGRLTKRWVGSLGLARQKLVVVVISRFDRPCCVGLVSQFDSSKANSHPPRPRQPFLPPTHYNTLLSIDFCRIPVAYPLFIRRVNLIQLRLLSLQVRTYVPGLSAVPFRELRGCCLPCTVHDCFDSLRVTPKVSRSSYLPSVASI
jgi:hypothetical protein